MTNTRGRDLSGSLAGAGGIGGLLARSHGYSGGNWSSHHAYHADGNGNVTALASSAGALQASYRYDPYGRYLAGGGALASANVLRFSSKPWVGFAGSATSGLYYYGYRFYDPYLQRWVNRDPIAEEGRINLYVYVHNSPLFFIDPHGLEKDRECLRECSQAFIADCMNGRGTVIGTLFGLGTYAVTDGVTTPTGRLKHFCWGGKLTRFGRAAAVGSFVGALELTYDNLPCIYGYLACIAGCPPQRFRCDFGTFWPSAYPDPLEPSCTFQNAPPTRLDILIPQVQL